MGFFSLWKFVYITLQHKNNTNSRISAASSTGIFPDAIIFFMALTCSSVVRLYSCWYPTCFSVGDLDGFTLGTYDGADMVLPEGSTEGTSFCLLDFDSTCQILQ